MPWVELDADETWLCSVLGWLGETWQQAAECQHRNAELARDLLLAQQRIASLTCSSEEAESLSQDSLERLATLRNYALPSTGAGLRARFWEREQALKRTALARIVSTRALADGSRASLPVAYSFWRSGDERGGLGIVAWGDSLTPGEDGHERLVGLPLGYYVGDPVREDDGDEGGARFRNLDLD